MEAFYAAVDSTPIIDHHAHNLLISSALEKRDSLPITTEAHGLALQDATSTLAHLRAVKQLSTTLSCEPSWPAVKTALKRVRAEPNDTWARKCFEGIQTVLIDDGLDPNGVHPYQWHDRLVPTPCKRILRIERLAESLINTAIETYRTDKKEAGLTAKLAEAVCDDFNHIILEALANPQVAGFKSVICYRTGLDIPVITKWPMSHLETIIQDKSIERYDHMKDPVLGPFFVTAVAISISHSSRPKPFQFHTGLGDNDMTLRLANPSYMQPFIEHYEKVNFVLLHASYPFTAEAGYLASVFKNVYLDIGEVFPMISQNAQEGVISEALALCPSSKLMWSTDGHWFPETYLLAVIQIREGLKAVLGECVQRQSLTPTQAIHVVEDLLFNTANDLYKLHLPQRRTADQLPSPLASIPAIAQTLQAFSDANPGIEYLRLQWMDYTSTMRVRILPIKRALKMAHDKQYIGIAKAVFGFLQQDLLPDGFTATGIYNLVPQYDSLRKSARPKHATVQCQFENTEGGTAPGCPRSLLATQVRKAHIHGLTFQIGFEIEIVFLRQTPDNPPTEPFTSGGHAWSTARALENDTVIDLLEKIISTLRAADIEIEQFHVESCPGQYEFILPPCPPLEAVDTLLAARQIISSVATSTGVRATLYPKPVPTACGSGAHVHISVEPAHHWEAFYGGILDHFPAITAITYSKAESYARLADGVWAGGTWVAWGTQNPETPLRPISRSHFEVKYMDGLANPYLAVAALLGAGIQNVIDHVNAPSDSDSNSLRKKNQPKKNSELISKDCPHNPSTLTPSQRGEYGIKKRLPRNLDQALEALEGDAWLVDNVLGEEVVDVYLKVKRMEMEVLGEKEKNQGEWERRMWLIERY